MPPRELRFTKEMPVSGFSFVFYMGEFKNLYESMMVVVALRHFEYPHFEQFTLHCRYYECRFAQKISY